MLLLLLLLPLQSLLLLLLLFYAIFGEDAHIVTLIRQSG